MPPKDDIDERNAIVEVRGGSAGEEAALFAEELFGMYLRYAERRGWKVEALGIGESDPGGPKEARVILSGRGAERTRREAERAASRKSQIGSSDRSNALALQQGVAALLRSRLKRSKHGFLEPAA